MRALDGVIVGLLTTAAACLLLGQASLARSQDLAAFYWLALGIVLLRAAVTAARPRKRS